MLKFQKEKSYQTKAKIIYILPVIFGIFFSLRNNFCFRCFIFANDWCNKQFGWCRRDGIPMSVDLEPTDAVTLSNLGILIDMNFFGFQYTANEIQELANSSASILMTTMMDILGAAILFALVEIGVGILIVFMSKKMYKRTLMR